jgi:hydrogenase maturation protease
VTEPGPPTVHVIGLGSLFQADDAFGPAVIAALREGWEFPDGVLLTDAGTPGFDLVSLLSGYSHVVLVDAVESGSQAGRVRTFSREEAIRHSSKARLSGHSLDLRETLLLLDATGRVPASVTLVGVEPERVEPGVGMSPSVRDAVPEAAKVVVGLLL